MTANRRNINDLRYLTRNNLIIPNNLDIRKNSTRVVMVTRTKTVLPQAQKPEVTTEEPRVVTTLVVTTETTTVAVTALVQAVQ